MSSHAFIRALAYTPLEHARHGPASRCFQVVTFPARRIYCRDDDISLPLIHEEQRAEIFRVAAELLGKSREALSG